MKRAFDSEVTDLSGGFSFKPDQSYTEDPAYPTLVRALDVGSYILWGVGLGLDGSILLYRMNDAENGMTFVARSDFGLVTAGVWHYLEYESTIHPTAGFLRVFLNGDPDPVASGTGIKTRRTSGAGGTHLDIGPLFPSQLKQISIDDMYSTDTTSRLGPRRIQTLRVNGNGATQDFTPSTGSDHSLCVDEVLANSTDYVSGTTVGQIEQFALTDLATDPVTIDEVNLITYMQKTDGGTRAVKTGLKSGATIGESADLYLPNGITRYDVPFSLDPNGSAAWDGAAVNALVAQTKITV